MRLSPTRLAAATLLVATALSAQATAAGWHFITTDRGVRVYDKPDPKRDVPMFKGVATLDAPIIQLLAILGDVKRSCEWNPACVHAKLVRKDTDFKMLFHLRLKGPWPVSDRDAILSTDATVSRGGKVVDAIFRAIKYPRIKPASGVVRFPRLIGRYHMVAVSPTRTRVVYTIDSESGGWLPAWVVRYATKKVPVGTLDGLRRQAKKTKGQYAAFVKKHTPAAPPAGPTGTRTAPGAAPGVAPAKGAPTAPGGGR